MTGGSGSTVRKLDARNPAATVKRFVIFAITVCCKNAVIAAILHDTKNCNFAVIAAMTADFAVQNSLYIIAKTATAIVMGFPEGWGDQSPHPFGDPPHHVGELKKEKRGEPHVHAILYPHAAAHHHPQRKAAARLHEGRQALCRAA
jgi:hypothetical protein